jgi:hypothetical protein
MNAAMYGHWSDVMFLLDEIDSMLDETQTPATAMEPIRLEPKPMRVPARVDPADFTETITIEPVNPVVKKSVAPEKFHDNHPSLPPLKLPVAPKTGALSEADIWNAAIAKASAAVERALSEGAVKRYDIYAIRAAAHRYVAECRKPIEWDEGHSA